MIYTSQIILKYTISEYISITTKDSNKYLSKYTYSHIDSLNSGIIVRPAASSSISGISGNIKLNLEITRSDPSDKHPDQSGKPA